MSLEDIRKQIDLVDGKLIQLLQQRMEQAILSKRFKKQVEDTGREQAILETIRENAQPLADGDFLVALYQQIFQQSKALQSKPLKTIAFQGEHGAYSEVAAKSWNPDFICLPCVEFADIFEGVRTGLYDYGIVPVENTLGGLVSQANDLMIRTQLNICGAIEIPINHCLVACPGTDVHEIRDVFSHPQALAQCRGFLSKNNLKAVHYFDTAGAAKMLSEKNLTNSAAICSALAAKIYRLDIMKESIEDYEINRTRFLILSKEANKETGNKCSIVFSTAHKSGTLFNVLEKFAKARLNLTRIESIPNEKGTYAFFLDFIGRREDEKVKNVLASLATATEQFRVLGFYEEMKL
ncbi:MAG TPA: prephenate dehydratase [Thermotogota bacterium]|nr:prephenate dehydratase [Thermotogota bacterium]HRW34444.1 prephenate dehydratase [Thermotogota bacterium]